MRTIGIFGTSGMAREAGDIAWELGLQPVYVARNSAEMADAALDEEVILEEDLVRYTTMSYCIGIGDNIIRKRVADRFGSLTFENLIHPTASFGKNQRKLIESKIGVIICAGARFTNRINVGNFNIFNQSTTIAHDVIIEDFVSLAPLACISGNVHIESGVWIGANATVNQGTNSQKLSIGRNTIVGSGAVVIESCEANSVYVGIPARKIK